MSRAFLRYGGLALLALLVVVAVASGWWRHLNAADLRAHYGELVGLVHRNPVGALLAFAIFVAAVTVACLPGSGILILLGGALFGTVAGGAASLIGIVLGSTCVFLACRAASPDRLTRRPGSRIARLIATLSQHAFSTLVVLRLTPVAPLSVVNIAAGFARVGPVPFIAASVIGSAPSNFVYAAVGAGLRTALARGATLDPAVLAKPAVVWPLIALAALAAVTWMVNVRRRR